MLYIYENTVRLTRGDTAYLEVPIVAKLSDGTEQPYVMDAGDKLTLTIKKTVNDVTALVQKELTGTNTFHFEPEDTTELAFGRYKYDVQLRTEAGDIYTIIEPTTFEIMAEVTT